MCGIFGSLGEILPNLKDIKETRDLLKHRGPDADGFIQKKYSKINLLLGHTRLAIVDLKSRSHQPFYYKNSYLIFNGEIYNYKSLRNELKSLGHKFFTKSDTEVLIHCLKHWGMSALDKLEGMWSFAWFDENSSKLYIARDRFGEKPLYFFKNNKVFYFASEIKPLTKLANYNYSINHKKLLNFMINGYKSIYKKNKNFIKNINEVEKGSFLEIDLKLNIRCKSYWNRKIIQNTNLSYQDAVAQTRELLIDSVRKQLNSDVPLAFCMSGGIDSNSLISIAKKILNYDVHGFTINNPDPRYRENSLINDSIKFLKIKHTYVNLNKSNFLKNLKKIVSHNSSPMLTLAHYLHNQLTIKMRKSGYKVSISGIGADELYTGYYDHHLFYLKQIKKNKKLFDKSYSLWKKNILGIVRNPFLKKPNYIFNSNNYGKHIYLNSNRFKKYLIKDDLIDNFELKRFYKDELRNRMYNETFYETIPVMLHEEDMNSMRHSIENRSPFLDRKLYEFAYSIPTKYLIHNGYSKAILRDSMKGIVEERVLNEVKKIGFNASIFDLMDLNDNKLKSYMLDNSEIFNYIKRSKIENLIKSPKKANSYSKFLFYFLTSKIFIDQTKNV